jgi:hypothetical protein
LSVLRCDAVLLCDFQHFFEMLGTTRDSEAKQYKQGIFYIAMILTKLLFVVYEIEYLYEYKENHVNYILSLHFRNSRGGCYDMNMILLQCAGPSSRAV